MTEIKSINRTNDYAFKRIFGSGDSKEVLISFLNAVLKPSPGQELVDLELLDREIDPKHMLKRGARLDILARTEKGTLINIEVQVANHYNINKRTLFYWAGLYHGQLKSGQDFSKLCKTITINILGFNWFRNDKRYHHVFHVREDKTGELLSDDLEIHFLELEKIKRIKRKPADDLESWMMYLNNLEGSEMEEIAMKNLGIRKALTIEQAFMQSEKERRIYELIEKAKRDEISALAGARAEGRAEGRVEGRAEGRVEGRAEGRVEGKAKMAQEAICKYLEVKFGVDEESLDLQEEVKKISELKTLNLIINRIYTAVTLPDVRIIIDEAAK